MIDYSVAIMYTLAMDPIKEFGTLGQRIKNRRQELKLMVKDLASKVGVHPTYITYIEKHGKIPSPALLKKIQAALDDPVLDHIYLVTKYPDVCKKFEKEQKNIAGEFLEKAKKLIKKDMTPEEKKEVRKYLKESQSEIKALIVEFMGTMKKLTDIEKSL